MPYREIVPCKAAHLALVTSCPVFLMQRDSRFFPVWAYVLPVTVVRLPISFIETLIWTVLTYFEVDLAPDPGRRVCLLSFGVCLAHMPLATTRR